MSRARCRAALALAATALAACAGRDAAPVVTLSGERVLISTESNLLASPFDVAVDERGHVWVLDYQLNRVLVLDGSGASRTVGHEGAGPGELSGPSALAVGGDTLRVVDRGNGRIQVLTTEGRYVRSYALERQTMGGEASLLPNGRVAFATYGIQSQALARVFDPQGRALGDLGKLVAPVSGIWDITAFKRDIARGRVPESLRNRARPLLAVDGGAWTVLVADPAVQRYEASGRLLWTRTLDSPELRHIRETFFTRNREDSRPFAFVPLSFVTDAATVGDEVWLLLNQSEDDPATLLLVAPDGELRARVQVPGAPGARQLAVDPARRTLYLALADARLLGVPLPPSLLSAGSAG